MREFQYGRLGSFFNQESKLPSFYVNFYNLSKKECKYVDFEKKEEIGDYVFYHVNEDKYMLSFCNSYVLLDKDFYIADLYLDDNDKYQCEYEASYLLMQAYMFRLVLNNGFMIHSAVAVYDNYGVLFCGESGAGKSTQANLWKNYLGAWILNYDKPCIINDNEKFLVHGSPWSGKEAIYKNECVPIKAIVFVNKSQDIRVARMSVSEAFAKLFLHNYVYPLNETIENKYASIIHLISEIIPVYNLFCDMSKNSAFLLYNELFDGTTPFKIRKDNTMKYRVKKDFQMNRIADEYIVVPRGSVALDFNAAVVFNETGAYIWALLQGYSDIDELSIQLAEKYSISADEAREDIKVFIDKMINNNLLDVIDD